MSLHEMAAGAFAVPRASKACPKTGVLRVKGKRYPITYSGTKTVWKRTRKAAKLNDFRFHDIRHDVGTKVLRATDNLKLTQRVLNHSDIKATMRYAHVLDEEVGAALDLVAKSRSKTATPSPVAKSRSTALKVA